MDRARRPASQPEAKVVEIRPRVQADSARGATDDAAQQRPRTFLFPEPKPVPPPPGLPILYSKYRRELLVDGSVKITVTQLRDEGDGTVTVLGKDELIVPADEVKLKGP